MKNHWFVIINPNAGNKKRSKYWSEIRGYLNDFSIEYKHAFTEYKTHEEKLVQQVIDKGFRKFIVVGGDGTLHHVVNGIMKQKTIDSTSITVGIIPIGTGNDWIKTYRIPKNMKKAIQCIANNRVTHQDIGVIKSGNTRRYFNNVGGIGYDAYVVKKVNRLKKLGSIAYLLAGIYGLVFYKKSKFIIRIRQQEIEAVCLMTIIGICQYSGGGMKFTEHVDPSDGLLDITVAKHMNLLDLLLHLPKLYTGEIVNHHKVDTYKTDEITITPVNSSPNIQADGELISKGTLTVQIKKKAIQFVVNSI